MGFVAMQVLSMGTLLAALCLNRRRARRGDFRASKRLILPVYHRIVWLLALFQCLSVALILGGLAVPARQPGPPRWLSVAKSAMVGLDWGLLHWIVDGTAVFLCQPSAGACMRGHSVASRAAACAAATLTIKPCDQCYVMLERG